MNQRGRLGHGHGLFGMPVAVQKFLGRCLITLFFAYFAYLIYPINLVLAALILLFGLLLAWVD